MRVSFSVLWLQVFLRSKLFEFGDFVNSTNSDTRFQYAIE